MDKKEPAISYETIRPLIWIFGLLLGAWLANEILHDEPTELERICSAADLDC